MAAGSVVVTVQINPANVTDTVGATLTPAMLLTTLQSQLATPGSALLVALPTLDPTFVPAPLQVQLTFVFICFFNLRMQFVFGSQIFVFSTSPTDVSVSTCHSLTYIF